MNSRAVTDTLGNTAWFPTEETEYRKHGPIKFSDERCIVDTILRVGESTEKFSWSFVLGKVGSHYRIAQEKRRNWKNFHGCYPYFRSRYCCTIHTSSSRHVLTSFILFRIFLGLFLVVCGIYRLGWFQKVVTVLEILSFQKHTKSCQSFSSVLLWLGIILQENCICSWYSANLKQLSDEALSRDRKFWGS